MDPTIALLTLAVTLGGAGRAWQVYGDWVKLGLGGFSYRYCLLSALSNGCLAALAWRLNAEVALAMSCLVALFYCGIAAENARGWLRLRARPRMR